MSYNRLKSLAANVAAIETAVTVHKQRRKATQEEKQVLAQYSGFGGADYRNANPHARRTGGADKPLAGGFENSCRRERGGLRPADEQYKGFRADCVLYAGFPH